MLHNIVIFFFQSSAVGAAILCGLLRGQTALHGLLSLFVVLANIFVRKQIILFGLEATASDALAIGVTLTLNLIQEYYGKEAAKRALIDSFLYATAAALLAHIHLAYTASSHDTSHSHFEAVLGANARIVGASIISFLISNWCDYRIFGFLRQRCQQLPLFLRSGISIGASHALDTVLFGFLGLYGLVTNLKEILLVSYLIKCASLAAITPFTMLSKRFISARMKG